ncbi:MAG: hypothetical protein KDD52_03815 [Bdellovibrionales bacterium]|nr:hypothetical protein [Bdellovibrionales bacterium]
MKKRASTHIPSLSLVFFLCLYAAGCSKINLFDLDPDRFAGICSDSAISYENEIAPIFSSQGCTSSGCHGSGTSSGAINGGLNLDPSDGEGAESNTDIIAKIESDYIDSGDISSSLILTKPLDEAAGGVSHLPPAIFDSTSDTNYQKILCWAIQNFEETTLTADLCKLSTDLIPQFSTQGCTTCHDSMPMGNDLDLTQSSSALRTDLLGRTGVVVSGDADASSLVDPESRVSGHPNIADLDTEYTEFVECWINVGAPDN